MERTIYSKYSNERAKQFCIRTDIVADDSGEKKVYKHALTSEGNAHITRMVTSSQKLNEAYRGGRISFCPCEPGTKEQKLACVSFPFLAGKSLQDVLKAAVDAGDDEEIECLLKEYIRRIGAEGVNAPFTATDAFENVFGVSAVEVKAALEQAGDDAKVSAPVSDIDMILSNLFVEQENAAMDAKWQVIDYEWTFDFPIPKGFLIYRGLYFAYYQMLYQTDWSLERLLAMAGMTEKETALYRSMEEHFQEYMGTGTLPVRNMQRLLGMKRIPLEELLSGYGAENDSGAAQVPEAEWIHVRKIRYQIDRTEYQDGSNICSGWAFAVTWDGRYLPVNIQIQSNSGEKIRAEITRRERQDVASALKINRVTRPHWGFDCVWDAPPGERWKIHFALGKKECIWERM